MFTGCIPAHAAYFSIFESMKKLLGADQQGHHPLKAAACGATATMSHDICMNPFDTVKQRMQLGYYKSVGHCFQSIAFKEGWPSSKSAALSSTIKCRPVFVYCRNLCVLSIAAHYCGDESTVRLCHGRCQ